MRMIIHGPHRAAMKNRGVPLSAALRGCLIQTGTVKIESHLTIP